MKDDPQLREVLRTSLPDVQVPGRFSAEVWQRIQARGEIPAATVWARLFGPLSALLQRPAVAAAALMLAITGGASLASVRATDSNERARVALVERHVATIDPYARVTQAR